MSYQNQETVDAERSISITAQSPLVRIPTPKLAVNLNKKQGESIVIASRQRPQSNMQVKRKRKLAKIEYRRSAKNKTMIKVDQTDCLTENGNSSHIDV